MDKTEQMEDAASTAAGNIWGFTERDAISNGEPWEKVLVRMLGSEEAVRRIQYYGDLRGFTLGQVEIAGWLNAEVGA